MVAALRLSPHSVATGEQGERFIAVIPGDVYGVVAIVWLGRMRLGPGTTLMSCSVLSSVAVVVCFLAVDLDVSSVVRRRSLWLLRDQPYSSLSRG